MIINIQTQQIISFIPIINKMRTYGYSYVEIAKSLQEKYNLTINNDAPEKTLSTILNLDKHNKLNSKFSKYKLFVQHPDDIDDFLKNSITTKYGFNFAYDTVNIPNKKIITKDNLNHIFDIQGLLIAKRLIRAHDIHDSVLVNNYMKVYKKSTLPDEYIDFITSIHINIIPIFNNLVSELKQKNRPVLLDEFKFNFTGEN